MLVGFKGIGQIAEAGGGSEGLDFFHERQNIYRRTLKIFLINSIVMTIRLIYIGLILLTGAFVKGADFPIQMPRTSSNYLFDESINKQVGFSVNQNDTSLSDLFNKAVSPSKSELCGPTTVANLMALYKFTNSSIRESLSLKYSPENSDYVNQVREYYDSCRTDSVSGTKIASLSNCIYQTFIASGLHASEVKVSGPAALPGIDPRFSNQTHVIGVNDIRDAFKDGYSVIMEVKWFQPVESAGQVSWVTTSGHYILVVGYDYDQTFGDQKIILKVVNPEVNYMSRDPYQRFDNIEMMKIPRKPGIQYPSGSDYVLDGFSFKGYPKRAFVRYLILSKPAVSP